MQIECNFEEKKLIIEKYLSDLKKNNDIKISLRLKNSSKIKKWKKGFSLNIKNYKNNNVIKIINGKIEEEVNPNTIINKNFNIKINNLEKINKFRDDYEFEICLFDDNNNIIGNNTVKIIIHINKFSFNFNENNIKEIYNQLNKENDFKKLGITLEIFKIKFELKSEEIIKEYPDITQDDFIDELKRRILDDIFW